MWIRVSLAILMVHPVIQRPLIHVALPTQFRTLSSILLARRVANCMLPLLFLPTQRDDARNYNLLQFGTERSAGSIRRIPSPAPWPRTSPKRSACTTHLILLDYITLALLSEQKMLRNYNLCPRHRTKALALRTRGS
jgi:hypothetical protein